MNSRLGDLMRDEHAQKIMEPLFSAMSQNEMAQAYGDNENNNKPDEASAINEQMLMAMMDEMPLRQLLSFVPEIKKEMLVDLINALNAH